MPLPIGLVVKNGSKILLENVGGNAERRYPRRDGDEIARERCASSSVTLCAEIVTVPPSGIASRALMTRLTSAVSSSETSTMTGQASRSTSNGRRTEPPTPVSSTSRTASMRSAKSIACGLTLCRRAKVSNWLVSAAPRLAAASIAEIAR